MKSIYGTWILKSFTITKDGQSKPWRDGSSGQLIYSKDHSVAIAIQALSHEKSTENEMENILFYSGTFEVKENQVHHHVEFASDAKRIGRKETRQLQWIHSNCMSLLAKGDYGVAELIWEKKPHEAQI